MRWMSQVLTLEIRKYLAYRTDFWISFLGSMIAQLGVAYFLWRAVFSFRGVDQLGGYSFKGMMLYYLMVALLDRVVRGATMGFVAQDIYDGGLNRYLVYPVSFFTYKLMGQLALTLTSGIQFVICLGGFFVFFGLPAEIHLSIFSVIFGVLAIFCASFLFFLQSWTIELIAFWADNTWSISVMFRFVGALLGGAMIPLSLFPRNIEKFLKFLPFESMTAFPIRAFLGQLTGVEYFQGFILLSLWTLILGMIGALVWRRGTLQYSGVAM